MSVEAETSLQNEVEQKVANGVLAEVVPSASATSKASSESAEVTLKTDRPQETTERSIDVKPAAEEVAKNHDEIDISESDSSSSSSSSSDSSSSESSEDEVIKVHSKRYVRLW